MKVKNTWINVISESDAAQKADAVIVPMNPRADREMDRKAVAGEAYVARRHNRTALYVIEVVIEDSHTASSPAVIRKALAQGLILAASLPIKSLTISSVIREREKLPVVGEAKIIIQEILKFLRFQKHGLTHLYVSVGRESDYPVFAQTIEGYVSHLQDDLGNGPYVTVDVIIELPEGVILIERSNPPYGWALPGGFVDCGESLEQAAAREAKEETNMDLEQLRQFHVYSDPQRDPRFHTVSTVFIAQGKGTPAFGDDAKGLKIIGYEDLLNREYAFDHKRIIEDYLQQRKEVGSCE
jgi:ADP-ribose pyrophosphatase YjhB (NUDIX family)